MGKAGKETKGPGVAGEGESWRIVSNTEAPDRPPYCIGVNNKRQPVPRAASDLPWSLIYFSFLYPAFLQILPAPPHTGVAGQADAQGKA